MTPSDDVDATLGKRTFDEFEACHSSKKMSPEKQKVYDDDVDRRMEAAFVDEELLGIDYDSVDQLSHVSNPTEFFSYSRVRPDARFSGLQPIEFQKDIPMNRLQQITGRVSELANFVSNKKDDSNNRHGYHIIIGAEALQKFFNKNRDLELCTGSGTMVTMYGAESVWDSKGLWIHLRRFVSWLTFIASPSFTRFYQGVLQKELLEHELHLAKVFSKFETDQHWLDLTNKLKVKSIFDNQPAFMWSMEELASMKVLQKH